MNVQVSQDMRRKFMDDHSILTEHLANERSAKDQADRELLKLKHQFEEAKADWAKKLKNRRKEVRACVGFWRAAGWRLAAVCMGHVGRRLPAVAVRTGHAACCCSSRAAQTILHRRLNVHLDVLHSDLKQACGQL